MIHQEHRWASKNTKLMYAQSWCPEGEIRGVLCIVHGMGEHSGRYAHVAEFFGKHGFATIADDHYGHGKSQGKRGHVASFEYFLEGVDNLLEEAEKTFPGIPKILYGHSLGGNIVLNYVTRKSPDLAGVVSTSAWLKLYMTPPRFKVWLAKKMDNIFPSYAENNGLDVTRISRDPEVVKKYKTDPLVHKKISARTFLESYGPVSYTHLRAHET